MRIETVAVHAGTRVDPGTGAVTPAIHASTTFERDPDGSYPRGFLYARNNNPNREALEECLAALEGGAAAAAFASASAATSAILLALEPGDHVVAQMDAYHGTSRLLRETFARWKLDTTFVDMTDLAALGADLVVHATTKYLGGHGDVLGGAVVSKAPDELFERIRAVQASAGAVPSPFDCWLVRRGIRTLPYRVRGHSENALRVATFLHDHPKVEAVHYPGLATHAAHDVARRQMTAFGGMVSVQVRGDRSRAMDVAAKLRVFTRATSFGGTESLVEHRASIEGAGTRTPENLLRLSIGLEHPEDLMEDLEQALS